MANHQDNYTSNFEGQDPAGDAGLSLFLNGAEYAYRPSGSDTTVYIPTVEKYAHDYANIVYAITRVLAAGGSPIVTKLGAEFTYVNGDADEYKFVNVSGDNITEMTINRNTGAVTTQNNFLSQSIEVEYGVDTASDVASIISKNGLPYVRTGDIVANLYKIEVNKYTFRTTHLRVDDDVNYLDIVDYIVNGSAWTTVTKTVSSDSSGSAYLKTVSSPASFDTTGYSGMHSVLSVDDVPVDGVYQLSVMLHITPKTANATKSDLVFHFTSGDGTGWPNHTFHAVVDDSQTFAQQLSFSTSVSLKAGQNTLRIQCGGLNTEYLVFVDELTVAQLVNGVYHNGDDFDEVHTLTEALNFNNDDGFLVDGATGGPRFMFWRTLINDILRVNFQSNPEYIYAITDANNVFLFGIKNDGSIEWAVGVPQPIKDWVNSVISVALSGKVDKEYGKSLINSVFSNGVKIIENEEFVYAVTDSADKFLFGVRKDGSFEWSKGIPYFLSKSIEEISDSLLNKVDKVNGKSLINAVFANGINIVQTKEFVYAVTDSADKFLFGVKADGSFTWAKGVPETIRSVIDGIINTLSGKVDKQEGKSLIDAGFAEKQSYSDNPELSKVLLSASNEILESVKKDGSRQFNNKVEFNNNLILGEPAYNDIEAALRAHGFEPKVPLDWSDADSVKLPKPEMAIINITGVDSMPQAKGTNAHAWIEFWDRNGNYFKKRIILNAQGSGSLQFPKKNFAFDLCNDEWVGDDTFKIKFGDWVEQDSFHGKAFWNDYFRGVANIGFNIYKDIQNTYDVENNRTWKQAQVFERYQHLVATGVNLYSDMYDRMDYGALCFPQGFPMIVYLNGVFYGLFTWNLKKHRDNYHMKKNVAEHIQIDPTSTKTLWDTDHYQNLDWTQIEIRNPKSLYCMDGTKYDGDNPKELIDNTSPYWNNSKNHKLSAKVKRYILDLRNNFKVAMNAMYPPPRDTATASAMMEDIFDIDNLLDYQLFLDWIQDADGLDKNWQWTTWDGHKWYVNPYDLDTIFGNSATGAVCRLPMEGMNIFTQYGPTWVAKELYMTRMKSRYAELRNAGVFDKAKLKEAVKSHYNKFTPDDWKAEWAKWNTCPLNIGLTINSDYWELQVDEYGMPLMERTASVSQYSSATSYSVGDYVNIRQASWQNWFYKLKAVAPSVGQYPISEWGQFDSFWRLCKWADMNQSLRDTQYNYNP